MNKDEYGEVINGSETYILIVTILKLKGSCLIGWTDEHSSHLDILFTYQPHGEGTFQGGIRTNDLYVSVMRVGAFAFEVNDVGSEPSYYSEKIGNGYLSGSTKVEFAKLINNVRRELNNYETNTV